MSAANESLGASAERVSRNEASFRLANEKIRAKAASWEMEGLLPALCECADPSCAEVLQLTPREYEAVRSEPRWFLNAPGHAANAQGWSRVVAENARFLVAEKLGEAGEIVEQLDPRTNESSVLTDVPADVPRRALTAERKDHRE